METININDIEYIQGDYVLKNAHLYSKTCRSSRDLIKKRDIKDFIFAKETNGKWSETSGKSIRFDKVLIKKSFVDNISELKQSQTERKQQKKYIIVDGKEAPDVIHLKDDEKLRNDKGEIIEIKTRGERQFDKIYFRVKDVMKNLDMDFLNDAILKKTGGYRVDIDYVYFIVKSDNYRRTNKNNTSNNTSDSKITKELYLTYIGILRVLFVSRNNNVNGFIKWAAEKLFTLQMGTNEQKDNLISTIKGVSYEAIQELFSANARTLPCVYLTAFNDVSKLRDVMNIDKKYPDDAIVYKFGLTKSFETRKNGHKSEYKKIDKFIDMKLVMYSYIDPMYVSEAENEIKELLNDYKIEYDNHNEIVIIPNNLLKIVKTIYENIGMKYCGHAQVLNKKIEELNKLVIEHDNKCNMYVKDIENSRLIYEEKIKNKDLIIENMKVIYEEKLKNKDLIIDNLKMELKIKELENKLIGK